MSGAPPTRPPFQSRSSNAARPRLLRLERLEDRRLRAGRAAEAINHFALDVYEHMQREEGNLFFSPLSIATSLAMAHAGAAGQTATMSFADQLDFVVRAALGVTPLRAAHASPRSTCSTPS